MLTFKNKPVNIENIKKMSYEELSELCYFLREEIIELVSTNGGHLSSNLGVVELTIALVRAFNFPQDKLLIDVGHQSYTYKFITGRDMKTLRKRNGVSGFQKRDESIYDFFEAGHSSTSLSCALGVAVARDLKKEKFDIVTLIGDASIMNGMSLEALNDISQRKSKIIIVLNDNNMSVSRTVGAIHNLKEASSLYKAFGLEYIGPIDGHNIKEIEVALNKAKKCDKSVVIHAYTEKGKGYPYAQYDRLGIYHGISPFKVSTGLPINGHPNQTTYSAFFGKLVLDVMEKHPEICVVNPAMTLGSNLQQTFLKYPHRCFDVGIAEEHAITFASGISLNGLKPIVSIYSTFLQRGFDQLSHDIARMKLNALFLIDRSGLVGEDGETHQGLYDEAFILNTPNFVLSVPSNKTTSKALFELGINYNGPFAIRYPRNYYEENDNANDIKLNVGEWIKEINSNNKNIAIISYGPFINDLKKVIIDNNYDVMLYNAVFLYPFDKEKINDILDFKNILIINTMATESGFNNMLISYLIKNNYKGKIISKAIKKEFISQGTINEQMQDSLVDIQSIKLLISDLMY